MSAANSFLDTNVLLYLLSDDVAKPDRAESLLAAGGVVSVQVLNEFAAVASRKLGMAWAEIGEILQTVAELCRVEPLTLETHRHGLNIAQRYGYSVYDAMILAAALSAKCATLWSEDMQDGQLIEGKLTIRNPFVG